MQAPCRTIESNLSIFDWTRIVVSPAAHTTMSHLSIGSLAYWMDKWPARQRALTRQRETQRHIYNGLYNRSSSATCADRYLSKFYTSTLIAIRPACNVHLKFLMDTVSAGREHGVSRRVLVALRVASGLAGPTTRRRPLSANVSELFNKPVGRPDVFEAFVHKFDR